MPKSKNKSSNSKNHHFITYLELRGMLKLIGILQSIFKYSEQNLALVEGIRLQQGQICSARKLSAESTIISLWVLQNCSQKKPPRYPINSEEASQLLHNPTASLSCKRTNQRKYLIKCFYFKPIQGLKSHLLFSYRSKRRM